MPRNFVVLQECSFVLEKLPGPTSEAIWNRRSDADQPMRIQSDHPEADRDSLSVSAPGASATASRTRIATTQSFGTASRDDLPAGPRSRRCPTTPCSALSA